MNKNEQTFQSHFLRLTAASGGWKGHVSCMVGKTNVHEVLLCKNPTVRNCLESLGIIIGLY